MPRFAHGKTTIHYEESGGGFPLLLIAPGAMNSAIELWSGATINPLEMFAEDFRLIAMDQRNAGRSTGPLELDDPWKAYAGDQLAADGSPRRRELPRHGRLHRVLISR